jgi:hypothetical protein
LSQYTSKRNSALRTEDIAKFGQLLLQRGEWNGRRLLPAEWVDQATARQTSNGSNPDSDWEQGYGFQFWRCTPGFYRGDGAFGQFVIVMPQYDTVVAINGGSRDMGSIMKMLWTRLLPEPARFPGEIGLFGPQPARQPDALPRHLLCYLSLDGYAHALRARGALRSAGIAAAGLHTRTTVFRGGASSVGGAGSGSAAGNRGAATVIGGVLGLTVQSASISCALT